MHETTYHVLMVDDEELIRRGFQARVPWKDLGFEFWEPCVDGRQALARLAAARPDVLITDINMPHIDGLELCRQVNAQYPDVLLVVLSGFDDFEYARTALRYRVWDYILKPLNVEDLKVFLGKLRTELDGRRTAALAGNEALGLQLLRGAVPEPLAAEAQRRLGDGYLDDAWACAHLETTWPGELATRLAPDEEAPIIVGLEPYPRAPLRRWKLLYRAADPAVAKREAFYGARRLVQDLRRQGDWAVAALAPVAQGVAGLPAASHDAEESLALRFLYEDEVYQRQPSDRTGTAGLDKLPDLFRTALTSGSSGDLGLLVARFEADLRQAAHLPRRLADELQALFNAVADLHPSPEDVDELRPVALARDADDLCRRLDTLLRRVKQRLDLESSPLADQKIHEFQALLARRFVEPQLGIDDLARDLNLSPSYLTKLLRKKLGRSFLDCLTETRMNAARHLLVSTNLMTYEIAERTGYAEARYFSSSFKKNNGTTPSEFRAQRRGDS